MIMKVMERATGGASIVENSAAVAGDLPESRRESETRAMQAFVSGILAAAEDSASSNSFVAARRRILRDLEEHGPQPFDNLPRAWPVTAQHVRVLVRGLEEDGLIERTSDAGRRTLFRLTSIGARALAATRRTQLDLISNLLRAAASGETRAALPTFRTLRAALDAPGAS